MTFGIGDGTPSVNLPPLLAAQAAGVMFDICSEGMIFLHQDGSLLGWNAAARTIFGHGDDPTKLPSLEALLCVEAQARWRAAHSGLANGQFAPAFESLGRRLNGTEVQLEIRLAQVPAADGTDAQVIGFFRDISEQRRSEAAYRAQLERQAGLAWLGEQVGNGAPSTLCEEAADLVRRSLGVDFVEIHERQSHGWTMLVRAAAGAHAKMNAGPDSQAAFTLNEREPVIVSDLGAETRFKPAPWLLEYQVTSSLSLGIGGGNAEDSFGVITVHSRERRAFGNEDVNYLRNVAAILAAAFRSEAGAAVRISLEKAEANLRAMEQTSWKRLILLSTASQVALDILSSRMGVEALRHIAHAARELTGAQYAALGVGHESEPGLAEFLTSGLAEAEELAIGELPRGHGILGLLLTLDEPLRVQRIADHPSSVGFPPNHPPMETFLGVPIRLENSTVGSLYLTNKENDLEFSDADEATISTLASFAAVAIYNLRLLSNQKNLTRSLLNAQEEERRAVAHDLHDGLTQYIMASHAHCEAYKKLQAAGDEARGSVQLRKGMQYLQEAVLESRRMINNLRLLVLDDLGLAGALEQLLQEEIGRAGWEATQLETNLTGERFDSSLETAIYRVAQEALTNARKHADSPTIRLQLLLDDQGHGPYLTLLVEDDGKGFELASGLIVPGHFGLRGQEERVHSQSGRCEFHAKPGAGVRIQASFSI